MEYLIGLVLAAAVAGSASVIGLDRERAFYPTVLMVIASYYVLFAAMAASRKTLPLEIVVASGFSAVAVVGFKKMFWLIPIGHGLFDSVHRFVIHNPGVPQWLPGFCLALICLRAPGLRCTCRDILTGAGRTIKRDHRSLVFWAPKLWTL
jgi:hypothetical protein